MDKFTPGPWHSAEVSPTKTWNLGVYDQSGTSLAVLKTASALSFDRRKADARLMATAPKLLDALRVAVENNERFVGRGLALAAISEATGEA